ncbi:MAG: hypothetical protein U0836_04830 [Pirellulales bacterium]
MSDPKRTNDMHRGACRGLQMSSSADIRTIAGAIRDLNDWADATYAELVAYGQRLTAIEERLAQIEDLLRRRA